MGGGEEEGEGGRSENLRGESGSLGSVEDLQCVSAYLPPGHCIVACVGPIYCKSQTFERASCVEVRVVWRNASALSRVSVQSTPTVPKSPSTLSALSLPSSMSSWVHTAPHFVECCLTRGVP